MGFRAFVGTMRDSDFLMPVPAARSRSPTGTAPCVRCLRNHSVTDAQSSDLGLFYGVPIPRFRAEASGPPRFPGSPLEHMPRASTPAAAKDSTLCRPSPVVFHVGERVDRDSSAYYRDVYPFGAQSRGLHSRCVRFAGRVTPRNATLATGWWVTFPGGTFTH